MNSVLAVIGGAVLCAALAVGAYLLGRQDGRRLAEGEEALAERLADDAARASREATADAIAKMSVKHTTIHSRLETEVRREKVYSDPGCRLTPGGLRDLNEALTGAVAGASELPASDAAGR